MDRKISPLAPRLTALLCLTLPGPASPAQTATPPPFALPPPAPGTAAALPPAVPFLLRAAMEKAHALWRRLDGGADYHSSLTYLRDKPALMLFTTPDEPGPRTLHRKRAMVQACGFLLDDTSFDRAIICVVELDLRKPDKPRVRNYDLRRPAFQTAAKNATQAADPKDALRQAREDDAHTLKICADLGID